MKLYSKKSVTIYAAKKLNIAPPKTRLHLPQQFNYFPVFAELPSSLTSTRSERGLPAVTDFKLFAGWQVGQRAQLPCVTSQQRQPITALRKQSGRDQILAYASHLHQIKIIATGVDRVGMG